MKHFIFFLSIALLLAACTPATTALPSVPTQTLTPAPTATQTPSPSPTIIPTPTPIGGGSGKIIFTLDRAVFEKMFPDLKGDINFFIANIDGTELAPVTNGLKGFYYIEGISPDGTKVLVSSDASFQASNGSLYTIDLSSGNKVSSKLASGITGHYGTFPIARWIDNTHITYIGNGANGHGIYIANSDGTDPKRIGGSAADAILAVDSRRVYWHSFVNMTYKTDTGFTYMYGSFNALWWTNLDGSGDGPLESNGKQIITTSLDEYAFSPDGRNVAWIPADYAPGCHRWWFVAPRIRDDEYTKTAGESRAIDMISPDPSDKGKIIDFTYVRDYVQRCFSMYVASLADIDHPIKIALMPPDSFFNINFVFGKDYRLTWWPDGSKIALLYDGVSENFMIGDWYSDAPVLFCASLSDPAKISLLYNGFLKEDAGKVGVLSISLDGKQILLDTNQAPTKTLNLQTMNIVPNQNGLIYRFLGSSLMP